ncbi:MAG TPA: Rne/Rng family ribonuclease [Acidobacteriota bacterium]|nr:Rne/Rng family ribonuclease [Acidobacteriota bacterium]
MAKELIVSASNLETRLAILDGDQVVEIFVERAKNKGILGNIVKGRVTKVLPGMQAAFVDIGLERNAFLYVSDFYENIDEYESMFDDEEAEVSSRARPRRPAPSKGKKKGRPVARGPSQRLDRLPADRPGPARRSLILPETLPALNPAQSRIAEEIERPPHSAAANGILPATFQPLGRASRSAVEKAFAEKRGERDRQRDGERANGSGQDGARAGKNRGASEDGSARADTSSLRRQAKVDSGDTPDRMAAPSAGRNQGRRGNSRPRQRRQPRGNAKNLISEMLKEGQEILVQVSKEPIAKKGARITSHVALPGRYMVYMPTVDHVGVSRRIVSEKERTRLRRIVMENRGDTGRGFIVRTAGENHAEEDLIRDIRYLTSLWEDIKNRAEKARAPRLIHSEPGLIERILRDHLSEDFRAIRVDDEHQYASIVEFVSRFNPALVSRVRLYTKPRPIFEEFGVAPEIEKALKEKVWLKSGGHIVINQTEALVAIDINTGKFVGSTNSLEDTITKTNIEAVKEIVRQIRLRDLGGIIIIDFIDMDERKNRQKVMDALQQELGRDKSPSKILQFNEFGLVAITRKRVKQSLQRVLCQPCIYCEGTGLTKSVRTICYSIHHEARKMMRSFGDGRELLIRCHPEIGKALRQGESQVVREIEEMTGKAVNVKIDASMHIESFAFVEV